MKTLTSIILGFGILLVTLQATATIEYCLPGTISWAMQEVDWWFAKFWGWTLFATLLILAVVVVGWIAIKVIPRLVSLIRKHWPAIIAGASHVSSSPKGRKAFVGCGVVILAILVLAVIIGGVWFLYLLF